MKDSKKFLSVLCACLMLFAVATSASAAPYYVDDSDDFVIDWSRVDTSMMIPGVPYCRSERPAIMPISTSERQHFLGWVYSVPMADPSGLHTSDKTFGSSFTFEDGDTGNLTVSFLDSKPAVDSINVSIFDITEYQVMDWTSIDAGGSAELYVDLSQYGDHSFKLVISHNGADNTISARVKAVIEEG